MTVVASLVAQLGFKFNSSQFNRLNTLIGKLSKNLQGVVNQFNQFNYLNNVVNTNNGFITLNNQIKQANTSFTQFAKNVNKTVLKPQGLRGKGSNIRVAGAAAGGGGAAGGGSVNAAAAGAFGFGSIGRALGIGSATALSYKLVSSLKDAVSSLKDAVSEGKEFAISAEKLAEATGTSLQQFIGIREVATRYRISREEFDSGFKRLNNLLLDARTGGGELPKIAAFLGVEFRKSRNETVSAGEFFLRAIDKIFKSNESKYAKIARYDLLLPGRGNEIFEFAQNGRGEIERLAHEFDYFAMQTQKNIEEFKKFESNMAQLDSVFKEIKLNISSGFVEYVNRKIQDGKQFIEFLKPFVEESEKSKQRRGYFENSGNATTTLNVTNNIQIDVPQNTSVDEATFISDEIQVGLSNFFNSQTRMLQTSVPYQLA